jgi:hypothetical protein
MMLASNSSAWAVPLPFYGIQCEVLPCVWSHLANWEIDPEKPWLEQDG